MPNNENRAGYKKTKVGWIPKDWECVPLGKVFKKRTARGTQGVPVYSVTQDRGMVLRATLGRAFAQWDTPQPIWQFQVTRSCLLA